MIKGSIHQVEITIINIYGPKIRAPKYKKQTLPELKGELDSSIIVEDVNTPLLIIDKTTTQKIKGNKGLE